MFKAIDLSGKKFHRLLVVGRANNQGTKAVWSCLCDCGRKTNVTGTRLKGEITRSCGCLTKETTIAKNTTHNLSKTPEYRIWWDMKRRCFSPKNKRYSCYGGRGISVCTNWKESFRSFYSDMGIRPSKQHSIDRINNDGNYEPSNCRWATSGEQAKNRRLPQRKKP